MTIDLQQIGTGLLALSGLLSAIVIITNFFKKPVSKIGEHLDKKEEQHIEEVIKEKVPELLNEHSEKVKGERSKETQGMIDGLKNALTETINHEMEELTGLVLEQDHKIDTIQESMEKLTESQKDVIKSELEKIYYKYLPYHKIRTCDRQTFMDLYDDYKKLKGNGDMEDKKGQVTSWDTMDNSHIFTEDDIFN